MKKFKESQFTTIYSKLLVCIDEIEYKGKCYVKCNENKLKMILKCLDLDDYNALLKCMSNLKDKLIEELYINLSQEENSEAKKIKIDIANLDTLYCKICEFLDTQIDFKNSRGKVKTKK